MNLGHYHTAAQAFLRSVGSTVVLVFVHAGNILTQLSKYGSNPTYCMTLKQFPCRHYTGVESLLVSCKINQALFLYLIKKLVHSLH